MKKSCSIDQSVLKNVCDRLCDNIENLLEYFNIEYRANTRFYSMCCPIHMGDNPSAVNIYHVGDTYRGNWKCRTHGCEKIFRPSILGFVRGIISRQKLNWEKSGDKMVHFGEVLDFIEKFLNTDLSATEIIDNSSQEKRKFVNNISLFQQEVPAQQHDTSINRSQIKKMLDIPSQYFLNRGFSKDILMKYDVGDCTNRDKPMYGRAVVPIYDQEHRFMIGCSGRSIFDKCDMCKHYHEHNTKCPSENYLYLHSKWRHSKGFKTDCSLYNLWYAKEHIATSRKAIIVESPGNVWKLEMAGIHNSVAIYGSSLTNKQKILLDTTGAMSLIVLTDNDKAGEQCRRDIQSKCEKIYNIEHAYASNNDVADMNVTDIKNLLGKYLL